MKKNIFLGTALCIFFLSSSLCFPSFAQWKKDEETGSYKYMLEDGSFAKGSWIDENGSRYYMDENGIMAVNQTLNINGTCYGFYGDGRLMKNDDITDVQFGYLNLYNSSDTLCNISSKWAEYSMELPGNANFISYEKLAGQKPIYEYLATVHGNGSRPVSISSCYFQSEKTAAECAQDISSSWEEVNFSFLSLSPVSLGNGKLYQKLSLVYDKDGIYGRPLYRDFYIRKIGTFCHALIFEYESLDADSVSHIAENIRSFY